jgi:hypothetical protein
MIRPSPPIETAPVTSACALIARQSWIGHRRVEARDGGDEGARRDLPEEAGAHEVRRHHPRDVARELRGVFGLGLEIWDRDRKGFDHPFHDLDPERTLLRMGRYGKEAKERGRQKSPPHHLIRILSGLNTISISRHWSYFSGGSANPFAPQRMIARRAAS